jgi:hypothetical protein
MQHISKMVSSMFAHSVIHFPIQRWIFARRSFEGMRGMVTKPKEPINEGEISCREDKTLRRLLSTPPQPKPKKAGDASPPKKRGRPKQEKGGT